MGAFFVVVVVVAELFVMPDSDLSNWFTLVKKGSDTSNSALVDIMNV